MKGKFFVSFLIGLVIFSSAYMWVWSKIGGGFSEVQALEEEAGVEQVENIEEGNEIKQANIDEVFFLLVGVDTSDVKNIEVSASGQTGIRSDTMILCRVNYNDGSIKMMSLPRDSRVPVKGALDKLGHAHSYGGMKLLMKTVRDFTNLDVDYYVRVDYKAVEKLVDAIGGVEVDIKQRMYKQDTTKGKEYLIDFQPGVQKLSGDQAILFLRYRNYKDGDVDRTKVQQYFLTEMIKQTLEPKNILKLPQILNVYSNFVDTNMDPAMIYSGVAMAGKLDRNNIETTTMPGEFLELYPDGNKVSYWKPYENQAHDEFERLFGPYLMD
ncbi:LCP family protein [Neofamilia massiliensis]|uniref:LCP family protein n=1 Tax=Neofamilia massiliensis TaxID=1673724 RepID=UPI0006BB6283|nr:LCP family protein [Neofamilia massiliensis]